MATPPRTHHAIAQAALEAGKHVLVEKPLATTAADARDLVALARSERGLRADARPHLRLQPGREQGRAT